MKKLSFFFFIIFLSFLFAGCDKGSIKEIEISSDSYSYDESFVLSNIKVKAIKNDGTYEMVPLNENMLSETDLAKFQTVGTHTIEVSYLEKTATFTITITGEKGEDGQNGTDGREIELQTTTEYIQWRYVGDTTWKNLIALSSLKGANGQTGPAGEAGPVGQDGEKAVFQVNNGFIEWKYETGTTWTKLLDLSSLNGADGKDGVTPVITINTDGYWVINGVATSYVAVLPSMKYNVTFDAKGGTLPTGASSVLVDVVSGCPIPLPIPTKQYYIFKGWYTGEGINDSKFNEVDVVNENLTLVAKWDVDYSYVSEFLNILKNNNYTASIKQEVEEGFFKEFLVKMQETNGEYRTYQEYYDEMLAKEYTLYRNNRFYELHSYYESEWDFSSYEEPFVENDEFIIFDATKFTKRDNAAIYDYDQIVDSIPNKKIVPERKYHIIATLDLSLMKIVYSVTRIEDGIESEQAQSIEVTFTNVGSTSVDFPFDLVKVAAADKLDRFYDDKDKSRATDLSITTLTNRVVEMKGIIENCTTIEEIEITLSGFISEIGLFEFVIDPLKSAKLDAISQISFELNNYPFATNESAIIMQQIYDEFILKINDSLNCFDVYGYQYQGTISIRNAYVKDAFKEQLYNYKNDILSKIYKEVDFGSYYLEGYYDNTLINIANNYQGLIFQATTLEEIDSLYLAAYQELKSASPSYYFWYVENYKTTKLFELKELYNLGLTYYGNPSESIDTLYQTNLELIKNSNNPYVIRDIFTEAYQTLQTMNLEQTKADKINTMNSYKEYKLSVVYDANFITIESLYNQAITTINLEQDINNLNSIVFNYQSMMNTVAVDSFKLAIYNACSSLKTYLYDKSITATLESNDAMQIALDSNLLLIKASLTNEEIQANYDNAKALIDSLFVEDLVKVEFLSYRDEIMEKFDRIYFYLDSLIYPIEKEFLFEFFREQAKLILESNTISEMESNYIVFYQELQNLPIHFDYYIFDGIRYNYINELSSNFYAIYDNYSSYDPTSLLEVELFYNKQMELICNNYNVLEVNELYQELKDYLLSNFKKQAWYYVQFEINRFLNSVVDSDIPTLESEITVFKNYFDIYKGEMDPGYSQLINLINDFQTSISTLTIDPINESRYNFINNASTNANELLKYATSESNVLISALLNSFITNMNQTTDVIVMESLNNNFLVDMYEAFILDVARKELIDYQDDIYSRMDNMVYELSMIIDSDIYLLYQYYFDTKDQVFLKQSKSEIDIFYSNWCEGLKQLPLVLNYTDDYKELFISWLSSDYYYFASSYETLPVDLEANFLAYVNQIEISTTYQEALINYYNGYYFIDNASIDNLLLTKENELQEKYQQMLTIAIDSELANLSLNNLIASTILSITRDQDRIYSEVGYYISVIENLQTDPLKTAKYNGIINLNNKFETLATTATADSIVLLQQKLDETIILVNNATTVADVETIVASGISSMDSLYVSDPIKQELLVAKQKMIARFSAVSNDYYVSLIDYNDYFEVNYIIQHHFTKQINDAATTDEINNLYLAWCEEMLNLGFDETEIEIEGLRGEKLLALTTLYNTIPTPIPENIVTSYNNYVIAISNATDVFTVANEYINCVEMINSFLSE